MKTKTIFSMAVVFLISFVLVVQQACKKDSKDDPENSSPPSYTDGEGEVGSTGGTVEFIDESSPINGTSIFIPEGALNRNVSIQISQAGNSDILYPGNPDGIIVNFEPSGLEFDKPVTIGLPYNLSGFDVSDLRVFYLDEDMQLISELPVDSIDQNKKIIYATTKHFSKFSAGERNAYMNIEMMNVNGKIGIKLNVFSKNNSGGESGLDGIITNSYWHTYNLYNGKDIIFWDKPKEVFSDFVVKLYAKKYGPWSNYLERKYFTVRRSYNSGGKKGMRIYDNKNLRNPIFEKDEIKDDKKYEQYFQGYPLVFVFDYDIGADDPNDAYYVKVEWSLAGKPDAYIGPRYTPVLVFNTYSSPALFFNMAHYKNDKNEDRIDDDYEIADDDGTFTDPRDGQVYKIVTIGSQTWFAQNLNYVPADWDTYHSWCYYNKSSNCDKYGRLYNWEAAKFSCPDGWHLPSQGEWETLFSYLGSPNTFDNDGFCETDIWKKLKSTSGWSHNGNNSSGFTALPGGFYSQSFSDLYFCSTYWWSATTFPKNENHKYIFGLDEHNSVWNGINRWYDCACNGTIGYSVRCIKDD